MSDDKPDESPTKKSADVSFTRRTISQERLREMYLAGRALGGESGATAASGLPCG